jgi:hypothetical protein
MIGPKALTIHRRSVVVGGVALGYFVAQGGNASAMIHIAMLGDSIFDNGSYVGDAPDVRAQAQTLLHGANVISAARDGAVIADMEFQIRRIPDAVTHIVVSIGGNDAIRASGVIDDSASTVSTALDKLGLIRDQFSRSYASMVNALLARRVPLGFCSIYEPRFPDPARRRAAANALTLLNDVITREVFRAGASLIDLRLICDTDADFANAIEPSAAGGAKIAHAIARFAKGDRGSSVVFA